MVWVWIFTRRGAVGCGLMTLMLVAALGWPSAGMADGPPTVTRAPDIEGRLVVGETLHAVNGAWSGTVETATGFTWLRCPDEDFDDCITIPRATGDSYQLTDADVDHQLRVTLWASESDDSSYKVSDPTAVVKATASGGSSSPGGSATPSFNVNAPVPTKAGGSVFPAGLKRIKPKPKVRLTGRYTSAGAKLSRFTIDAPKGTTVKLACSRGTCPVKKQTLKSGHTSRISKFERALKTGTRIQLTVSRKGYVTEATVITIRARRAPARSDGCIAPGKTKLQKCPA